MNELQRLAKNCGWSITAFAENDSGVWALDSGASASLSYPDDGNQRCFALEDGSFWFRHRNNIIKRVLQSAGTPQALWDVGSGNGFVARSLQDCGIETICVEPGRTGCSAGAARGLTAIRGRFEDLRLPGDSVEAIGCFDVLEHLAEPQVQVREFYRTLKPGGIAVVTVPALSWLWNQHDEFAGHFRRYSTRQLTELFADAGFACERVSYFMAPMLPPYFLLRTLPFLLGRRGADTDVKARTVSQLKPPGRVTSAVIGAILGAETRAIAAATLPFGTSVIGLFRKRSEARIAESASRSANG